MTQAQSTISEKNRTLDGYFLVAVILSIFAIAPLFYPGYFQTHTGYLPLWSVNHLRENITDLSWLPVLVPFNPWRSDGLLPYYLAALLPLKSLNAIKLVSVVGILAASSGLYLWLKSWLGSRGACVGSLVYVYSPFLIAALYVRGAWGEAFFWGLLPWALLAATYLVAQPKPALMIVGLFFWLALGLSQLGLTMWAFIFLLVMQLIFHRPQALRPIISALAGLILALLITLSRLVHELGPSPFNYSEHLVYPSQLLSSFWGPGLSQPGWADGLSLGLGLAAVGLAMLSVIIWRGGPDRRPWLFLGVAAFVALMTTPFGGWLWAIPGLNHLLTYPWQLLGFAALCLAVVAGVGLWLDERLSQPPIFAALLIFILLPMYPNLEPDYLAASPPNDPLAIYGQNDLVLLSYNFYIENPEASDNPDLPEAEQTLPITAATVLEPRSRFYLDVRWQAINPIERNYKVFGHLIDQDGTVLDQVDVYPQQGTRPTDSWLPGEVIEDTYTFVLPGGRTAPEQVWLGFYDEATLARLPALGDDQGRTFLNVRQ